MTTTIILSVIGLVLLLWGGEWLVKGASRVALVLGISPLVIGLTVVAFGTSAPELGVSLFAALEGKADIAVGNAVGSSIMNILLILGAAALITPIVISRQLIRWDVPVMVTVTFIAYLFSLDGRISPLNGTVLVTLLVLYTLWSIRLGRKEEKKKHRPSDAVSTGAAAVLKNLFFIAAGLGMLVVGSQWLVDGAIVLAEAMGVSELVIGLTVVAVGTSLPEIATSIIATIRGERDIAVGNVVGSNIFNILSVVGISSAVLDDGLSVAPAVQTFDFPVLLAVSVACLPIFFTGGSISRWEGVLFLSYYAAYTTYIILDSAQHDALPMFSAVMLQFVIPLTVLTILTVLVRQFRASPGKAGPEKP